MIKKLLLVVIAKVLLVGCVTSESKTYKTLRATQTAVVAAMETYRTLYNAGEIDAEERADIRKKYTQYQEYFDAALTAAEFDYRAATPEYLAAQVATLILTVENL